MFSLPPVYHKAESLDKGFSAWYKMLSNAVVQYLVSRADLKEMASTVKQNTTPAPKNSGRQVQQRVQVWCTVIITALLFHRADFYLDWISAISTLYVHTCVCVCTGVHFLSKRRTWMRKGGDREYKIECRLPRWKWYLFSITPEMHHSSFCPSKLWETTL